jgi:antitoxin component YwqK of YwqJK toxin-antitoxin module
VKILTEDFGLLEEHINYWRDRFAFTYTMKNIFTILSFVLFTSVSLAQQEAKQEKILYIIDNVPVINDPDEKSGNLQNEDVDRLVVVIDTQKIKLAGYPSVDKIIYVTTKEYMKRTDEVNKIPTTKLMKKKDGRWYTKGSSMAYEGPFIDYFLNGKIQGKGTMKNGVVDGVRTVYYQNGNKRYFYTYLNGVENGDSEEYFPNSEIKQKGSFSMDKQVGTWRKYYSTGQLKSQTIFINANAQLSKDEKKFYNLQSKAVDFIKEEDYKSAVKKLDEAETINNKYADLYFYRGTAQLNDLDFDAAIIDFDKAIELEPLYMEAIANRAFAHIRKFQFKDGRTLSKTNYVTILATKDKVDIPKDALDKICADLNKAYELGDKNDMILDAIKTYCK